MTDLICGMSQDDFISEVMALEKEVKEQKRDWDGLIQTTWVTGGMEGGSCWDTPLRRISPEEEPEDEFLVTVLEKFAPSITFLQFKRLTKDDLYERYETTEREYYGNYTETSHRDLDLEVLFTRLKAFYD